MPRAVDFIVDARRTCLQQRFFANFDFPTEEELLAAVSDMEVGLESIARSSDAVSYVYSGWVYWFLFLKGYLQYLETHEIADENVYFRYITRYYAPRGHDPGVASELLDVTHARGRIQRRFCVLDLLRSDEHQAALHQIEPIVVTVSSPAPEHPLRVYAVDAPEALGGRLVDGWHRLFAARLTRAPVLRGRAVFEDEALENAG